jgi:hypothetical protein
MVDVLIYRSFLASREQQRKEMSGIPTDLEFLLEYSRKKRKWLQTCTWSVTKAALLGSCALDKGKRCDFLWNAVTNTAL